MILTQHPIVIELSRPAMRVAEAALGFAVSNLYWPDDSLQVQAELANLCNLLQNLLERSEPAPGNLDLIGG